jgi:excisionase family DNA binding protein
MQEALKGATAVKAVQEMPDVMTTAEVANVLKVNEKNVLAAIKAKELKAKKVGDEYRVTKANLEKYLGG